MKTFFSFKIILNIAISCIGILLYMTPSKAMEILTPETKIKNMCLLDIKSFIHKPFFYPSISPNRDYKLNLDRFEQIIKETELLYEKGKDIDLSHKNPEWLIRYITEVDRFFSTSFMFQQKILEWPGIIIKAKEEDKQAQWINFEASEILLEEQIQFLEHMDLDKLSYFWPGMKHNLDKSSGITSSYSCYQYYIMHSKDKKSPSSMYPCLTNQTQIDANYQFFPVLGHKILKNHRNLTFVYYLLNLNNLNSHDDFVVWFEAYNPLKLKEMDAHNRTTIIQSRDIYFYHMESLIADIDHTLYIPNLDYKDEKIEKKPRRRLSRLDLTFDRDKFSDNNPNSCPNTPTKIRHHKMINSAPDRMQNVSTSKAIPTKEIPLLKERQDSQLNVLKKQDPVVLEPTSKTDLKPLQRFKPDIVPTIIIQDTAPTADKTAPIPDIKDKILISGQETQSVIQNKEKVLKKKRSVSHLTMSLPKLSDLTTKISSNTPTTPTGLPPKTSSAPYRMQSVSFSNETKLNELPSLQKDTKQNVNQGSLLPEITPSTQQTEKAVISFSTTLVPSKAQTPRKNSGGQVKERSTKSPKRSKSADDAKSVLKSSTFDRTL